MAEIGVVIVAGGSGKRMGAALPKQFMMLGNLPILGRTINSIREALPASQIVVVLPEEHIELWKNIAARFEIAKHSIATGGKERFHSVKNGLALVKENGLVGVHDGVRPFVSQEVIARCYDEALSLKAVIPVVGVVETVRHLTDEGSETVPRDQYKLVQTPQVFDVALLRRAYQQEYTDLFTDDASVVEALGEKVHLVEGNRENIKLTTPFDLKLAELLCST